MTTTERFQHLYHEYGQSPWLDNLKRSYLTDGTLAELVHHGIRGLTSNPTIFQKAIQGSAEYDEQFSKLAKGHHAVLDDYWSMVLADINGALDAFAPLYHDSHGRDGYVSVEVDPGLAHDGPGTEAAARALDTRIARPNVMIKIPGTEACLPAIEQMVAEGRNINVTLIFSLDRYQQVMDCLLYTSPSPRDRTRSRMPSSA